MSEQRKSSDVGILYRAYQESEMRGYGSTSVITATESAPRPTRSHDQCPVDVMRKRRITLPPLVQTFYINQAEKAIYEYDRHRIHTSFFSLNGSLIQMVRDAHRVKQRYAEATKTFFDCLKEVEHRPLETIPDITERRRMYAKVKDATIRFEALKVNYDMVMRQEQALRDNWYRKVAWAERCKTCGDLM